MQKLKAIIVDDERLARNELRRLLEAHPAIDILTEASNGEEAIQVIEEYQPDLVFLDIQMPGKDGFEVLSALGDNAPEVIFTTAYDEFALKAFEFHAADYLLKPIDPARLADSLKRLLAELQPIAPSSEGEDSDENEEHSLGKILNEQDQIFVKDGEKCWFIKVGSVRLFESLGNYVRIYFENQKPLVLRSLNALEARLDPKVFFRANRKHIINMKMIASIEPYFSGGLLVHLSTGEKIEISRRQAIRFKDLMSL